MERMQLQLDDAADPRFESSAKLLDGLAWDTLDVAQRGRSAAIGATWGEVVAISARTLFISAGSARRSRAKPARLQHALRMLFAAPGELRDPGARLLEAAALVDDGATAFVGLIDRVANTLRYVTIGAAAAYVRYADGGVAALPGDDARGGDNVARPPARFSVDLHGIDLVVVANAREDSLLRLLADERLRYGGRPAALLGSRLADRHPNAATTLLAVTLPVVGKAAAVPRPKFSVAWTFEATALAASRVRSSFRQALEAGVVGGASVDLAAAELIFGELLSNVVRHAPGNVDIILDRTADLPVLHVIDNGPGYISRRKRERLPTDDYSESGRGLFLISACASQFRVRRRSRRGTHVTVTLRDADCPAVD